MKKTDACKAAKIAHQLGLDISGDGLTFYATNEKETEIYCFDTKKERDSFIRAYNKKFSKED